MKSVVALFVRGSVVKRQEDSVCIKISFFCIEAVHDVAFLAISWEKIRQ